MHRSFVVAQVVLIQPLLVLIASLVGGLMTRIAPYFPTGFRIMWCNSIDVDAMPGTYAEKGVALRRLVQRLEQTPGVVKLCLLQILFALQRCRCGRRIAEASRERTIRFPST